MRDKIKQQTYLSFSGSTRESRLMQEYEGKYNRISEVLDDCPQVLDAVHDDLQKLGKPHGRGSTYSAEQFLRMILVRTIESEPYRATIIRVTHSEFLRGFVRIGAGRVMEHTRLSKATKCIEPSTWELINGMLFQYAQDRGVVSGEKARLDSTLCETNIRYPTDSGLLWDSFRVLARLMRQAQGTNDELEMQHRFHDRKVKALHTFIATHADHKNRSTQRRVKSEYRTLIQRVSWIHEVATRFCTKGGKQSAGLPIASFAVIQEIRVMLPRVKRVIEQATQRVLRGESVPNDQKIFSIFEDHTELIKRGKAGKPVEFGHMVSIAQTGEKFITYYDVMQHREADNTRTNVVLRDHRERFGTYPKIFTGDKNYYISMEHCQEWEKEVENFSVAKKGNRNDSERDREHTEAFRDGQRFRAGCEGSISVLKRAFGLRRCLWKGFYGFAACVGCLVFAHNIVLLTRLL